MMAENASEVVKDAIDRILCFPDAYQRHEYVQDLCSVADIISRGEIDKKARKFTFPELAQSLRQSEKDTSVSREVPATESVCVESDLANLLASHALAPGHTGIDGFLKSSNLRMVIGDGDASPISILNFTARELPCPYAGWIYLGEDGVRMLDTSGQAYINTEAIEQQRCEYIAYDQHGLGMCIPGVSGNRDVNIKNFADSMFAYRERWVREIETYITASLSGPSTCFGRLVQQSMEVANKDDADTGASRDYALPEIPTLLPDPANRVPAYQFATWDEEFGPRHADKNYGAAAFCESAMLPAIDDMYISSMYEFLESNGRRRFNFEKPTIRFGDNLEQCESTWVWIVPPQIAIHIPLSNRRGALDDGNGNRRGCFHAYHDTGAGFFYEVNGVWNAFYFLIHSGVPQFPIHSTDAHCVARTSILFRDALCCGIRYADSSSFLKYYNLPHKERFYGSPVRSRFHAGYRGRGTGTWESTLKFGMIRERPDSRDANIAKGILAVDVPCEAIN